MVLRLVNFVTSQTGDCRIGAMVEDEVLDLAALAQADDDAPEYAAGQGLEDVLGNQEWLDWARQAAEAAPAQYLLPRAQVCLLAPIPVPGKLFCLACNFPDHVAEAVDAGLLIEAERDKMGVPRVFMKPSTDMVIGDGEPVILSRNANFVDYEAEMAVIMSKEGRYIPEPEAMAYVGGISAFNDISERQLEAHGSEDVAEWDRFFDWLNGKWFDSFAPLGPCIVPIADVPNLDDLRLRLYLNDELKQDASTGHMIFKVPEVVAYISSVVTLRPGDVIAMGTPSGVGHPQGIRLQDGDVVRVELDLVGTLTNPICAET